MVEATVAYWHVVRCERAIFDAEWSPRMGVFYSGIKRSCIHSTLEKAPLLFSDVYDLRRKGETSLGFLTQAVGGAGLASGGVGLGQMLHHAVPLRGAVSVALAFFGVRRASEVAGLRVRDVRVDNAGGRADIEVRQQKMTSWGRASSPGWYPYRHGGELVPFGSPRSGCGLGPGW